MRIEPQHSKPAYELGLMVFLDFPEEIPTSTSHLEGKVRQVLVNTYERNPAARSKCIARVMKSHFISYRDSSPLWDENVGRGFRNFVQERQKPIEKAFNEAAGIRLFDS